LKRENHELIVELRTLTAILANLIERLDLIAQMLEVEGES